MRSRSSWAAAKCSIPQGSRSRSPSDAVSGGRLPRDGGRGAHRRGTRGRAPARSLGSLPLLRAREAGGVAGQGPPVGRDCGDSRVQGLTPEAGAPPGPLALPDYAAATGRRARRPDVDAANSLLPVFAKHALWRPKAREFIGALMRDTDIRMLREDLEQGIRLAQSLGIDASDIVLPAELS